MGWWCLTPSSFSQLTSITAPVAYLLNTFFWNIKLINLSVGLHFMPRKAKSFQWSTGPPPSLSDFLPLALCASSRQNLPCMPHHLFSARTTGGSLMWPQNLASLLHTLSNEVMSISLPENTFNSLDNCLCPTSSREIPLPIQPSFRSPSWEIWGFAMWPRVFLERSYTHSFTLCAAVFVLQVQSWVVATQTVWATKPKVFTILTFVERIFQPILCFPTHWFLNPA